MQHLVTNDDLTWCHHILHGWCIRSTYTPSSIDHSYKVCITHHSLQLCYNPLHIAMWQHNIFLNDVLKLHIGFSSFILDGVRWCHVAQYKFAMSHVNWILAKIHLNQYLG